MKKIIAIMLALTFVLVLSACGGTKGTEDASENTADTVSEAFAQTEAAQDQTETDEEYDVSGEYYVFAIEREGYRLAIPTFGEDKDGMITLAPDGSGSMLTGDVDNKMTWTADGDTITFMDETGMIRMPVTVKILSDGVFSMSYDDEDGITYYAKLGADISGVDTITVEEYKEMVSQ